MTPRSSLSISPSVWSAGATLQQALEQSIDDLDGTFTYLVSTAQGIGMAKDFFATKPLIVAETDRVGRHRV